MNSEPETISSLASFLLAFQQAKNKHLLPRVGDLRTILSSIAEYRAADRPQVVKPGRVIDPVKFTDFLSTLESGVSAAKRDGKLLNVWTVARLGRDEVRTAAVLTWVLDCHGSHGYGSLILETLLSRLKKRSLPGDLDDVNLGHNYRTLREHTPFGDQSNRVDIVLEGGNSVIFLEVKIDAPPGPEQLQRYKAASLAKASATKKEHARLLYLSRTTLKDACDGVIFLNWVDVSKAIHEAVAQSTRNDFSGAILRQFANYLKNFK